MPERRQILDTLSINVLTYIKKITKEGNKKITKIRQTIEPHADMVYPHLMKYNL